MLTRSRSWVSLAAWSVLTATGWILFVPGQVSVGNWTALNAGVLALVLTVIVLVEQLQPARTMSPVLHEGTNRTSPQWS